MPRLGDAGGGDSRGGGNGGGSGGAAMAYPNSRRASYFQILILLIFIGILKNILFTDYRSVEINYLRAAGKSEEEINQLIPKTPAERAEMRRNSLNDYQKLQLEVELLKKEVKELREKVFSEEEEKEGQEVVANEKEGLEVAEVEREVQEVVSGGEEKLEVDAQEMVGEKKKKHRKKKAVQ